MHPNIVGVINALVYGKGGKKFELESAEKTRTYGKERLSNAPLEGEHIGIYDTGTVGSLPNRTDSGSYYNLYQAFLAVALAKQAVKSGYQSIGIISPFRSQTNLIQKIVKDENLDDKVEADTVHRFQGGEKQIIIFDTTTSDPTKLTDDQAEGGDDEKLLNVAFSRSQEKCIVLADIQNIEKKHSLSSLLRGFLQYCKEKQFPIIPSEEILSKYSVNETTEKWLKRIHNVEELIDDFETSQLFSETDFYQNFVKDLFQARHEVVIDSPYITSERTRFFIPIFKHLTANGIKVFILTRQPKEHSSPMRYQAEEEIKNFESMEIKVLPLSGHFHRKLAVIDRNVLWEGSLNILSQRDSHEIMRRFEGAETAKQMMAFLKLDKNIGEMGESRLQRCEFCQEPGAWYWKDKGRYSVWTFCLVGKHREGMRPKSKEENIEKTKEVRKKRKQKREKTSEGAPICQDHHLPMVKKNGRFGPFWGCSKYPVCRITEKIS
jgi:hypothetical protein